MPVRSSRAPTLRMPLASIRKCTWMRGRPAGIGGMPRSLKRASDRLSATSSRSPCSTWMSTAVWLSTDVVNISLPLAGMGELRKMIFEVTPPTVSMPSESGVTSSSSMLRLPVDQDVGLHGRAEGDHLVGVELGVRRPAEQLRHRPPHERDARRPAHQHHLVDHLRRQAGIVERLAARADRALDHRPDESLELGARDRPAPGEPGHRRDVADPDLGLLVAREVPLRLDDGPPDHLYRLRGCRATRRRPISRAPSTTSSWSMSSPPRWVSPLVASTSKTPSSTRRMEMSKVPPPRS